MNPLTRLEKLYLSLNRGLGAAGAPGHGLAADSKPRLTEVDLSDCGLTAVPPAVLSQLPALQALGLWKRKREKEKEFFSFTKK